MDKSFMSALRANAVRHGIKDFDEAADYIKGLEAENEAWMEKWIAEREENDALRERVAQLANALEYVQAVDYLGEVREIAAKALQEGE